MLRDAEEFAEQDKIAKERIDSKNALDSYVHSMRNTIEDPEKLANKLDDHDKTTIKDALKDTQDWLDGHAQAEKEEYEAKLKELEEICNPIVSKAYKDGSGASSSHEDVSDELWGDYCLLLNYKIFLQMSRRRKFNTLLTPFIPPLSNKIFKINN